MRFLYRVFPEKPPHSFADTLAEWPAWSGLTMVIYFDSTKLPREGAETHSLSSTAQKHAADFEAIGKERHLEQLAEKNRKNANIEVWAEKTQE